MLEAHFGESEARTRNLLSRQLAYDQGSSTTRIWTRNTNQYKLCFCMGAKYSSLDTNDKYLKSKCQRKYLNVKEIDKLCAGGYNTHRNLVIYIVHWVGSRDKSTGLILASQVVPIGRKKAKAEFHWRNN